MTCPAHSTSGAYANAPLTPHKNRAEEFDTAAAVPVPWVALLLREEREGEPFLIGLWNPQTDPPGGGWAWVYGSPAPCNSTPSVARWTEVYGFTPSSL